MTSDPALVPHTQHGRWVTTSRAYRWMLFRQHLGDVGFALGRLALLALVVGAVAGCVVLAGWLFAVGGRMR